MRHSFDLLAAPYRWLEWATFGRSLQRCRTHRLPALAGVRNALLLGDGDGRFTVRLLACAPDATATAVDGSPAMLRQLVRRCAAAGVAHRLTTCVADLRLPLLEPVTQQRYDLVTTHFFLDCLSQADVELLTQEVVLLLVPGGRWVVSEFQVPSGVLRLPARLLIRSLYFGFRLLTGLQTQRLPDYRAALHASGMRQQGCATMLGGVLVSELWVAAEHRGDDAPPVK